MPSSPVALRVDSTSATLVLSPDGGGPVPADAAGPDFDPLGYGEPMATPFDASSVFDRRFTCRSAGNRDSSTATPGCSGR